MLYDRQGDIGVEQSLDMKLEDLTDRVHNLSDMAAETNEKLTSSMNEMTEKVDRLVDIVRGKYLVSQNVIRR